jgi:hypothetical protein
VQFLGRQRQLARVQIDIVVGGQARNAGAWKAAGNQN